MTQEKFWSGFVAGTAIGAFAGIAGVLLTRRNSADIDNRVVRLEKSVNIGRPVQNVFAAWSDFERLPRWIDFIRRVERYGTQTRWLVNMDGREFEWDAQITQVVPNESIGWKSLSGPKHTGRITFSPLGNQTVVHVLMNYAPGLSGLGGFSGFGSMLPIEHHLEEWIDRGLREFKQALEREGGAREARTEFTSPGPGGFNAVRRDIPEPRDWEPVERTGTEDVPSPGKHSAP
ncbi:MAG TPA: SRPBCC family protein [Candidatus Angelobacter sp.]|nr:SRPBCC family protein [Candidatus Angelobacter sp.]